MPEYPRFSSTIIKILSSGVLLLLIAFAFAVPRFTALGRFVTADEPTWGKRSATFYLALSKGDYPASFLSPHPGVTTMWAGAGAFALKFPKYLRVGELRMGDTKLFQLFFRHGPRPIEVLAMARALVVSINLIAFLLGFIFARRVFGLLPATIGFLLIAFDPFYLAHSRLLHVDGLLSSFLFLSVLAFLDFLRSRSRWAMMACGVAAGLSLLTKTPAVILVPLFLMYFVLEYLYAKRAPANTGAFAIRSGALNLLVIGAIAGLVVFLFWPALWRHPIETIAQTYAYSAITAEGELGGAQFIDAFESGGGTPRFWYFYPLTYIWRATPVGILGLIAAGLAAWRGWPPLDDRQIRFSSLCLLLFVAVFALVMTISEKKFDRYLLPVYLPLDLLAGLGWAAGVGWLIRRLKNRQAKILSGFVLVSVLLVQIFTVAFHYPYYLTYFNPMLGGVRKAQQVMMVGWGEGLNEAATYLRQVPNIQDKVIYSWYPLAFNWYSSSYKFLAESMPFPSGSEEEIRQVYEDADYIVVYINEWQRGLPAELFDYLQDKTPEHTVQIEGVEFVRIYKINQ